MPIEFTQYPPHENTGSSSDTTRLVMMYDGSGRRVSKTSMRKAGDGDWDTTLVTHYTGIGTEVRENFAGPAKETKVVVNMPQGLGRYKVADASQPADDNASRTFEWYLKNHLGSTMLVYGTVVSTDPNTADIGETKAAYDYRAFGEQVELLPHDLAKVTENFTGKEHDDEIALNYFGARYLDPMLGMWISVDPKRQYQNPYIYVGNNPIMGTDPDGLWGFSASVGVKGAVIAGGLINLSVNYDSERPEANKVMLTIGYGVGIDIGISKLKFKMFNKTLSKVEHVNGGPSDKDPKTGWHSQIDASLGALPIQGSFKDGATTPSSFGLGIGGGYYDTYTVDVGKFFNDKTENEMSAFLKKYPFLQNVVFFDYPKYFVSYNYGKEKNKFVMYDYLSMWWRADLDVKWKKNTRANVTHFRNKKVEIKKNSPRGSAFWTYNSTKSWKLLPARCVENKEGIDYSINIPKIDTSSSIKYGHGVKTKSNKVSELRLDQLM